MTNALRYISAICTIALIASCSRLRNVPEGEAFLRKQRIKVENAPSDYNIPTENLTVLARQKPNRKILWFRFNHSIYLLVNKQKLEADKNRSRQKCLRKNEQRAKKKKAPRECKTWRMFWAYTVGEPTVMLDSAKALKSAQQMEVYLNKKGYFDAQVIPDIIYNKKGDQCKIQYRILPGEPYRIRSINYNFTDPIMAQNLPVLMETSKLDTASIFDLDLLNAERERITEYYNNRGYFDFTKDYIVYDADSSLTGRWVDVTMILEQPLAANPLKPDSLMHVPHKKYFIGDIYIHTQFDPGNLDYVDTDTLKYDGLNILYSGILNFKPSLISCTQGFAKGDLFQKNRVDNTYKRYSQLGVMRATSIQLVPRPSLDSTKVYILDTHIRLTPAKKQAFSLDPRVTHRDGNMGIYATAMYKHKNLFKGAESLEFRIVSGLEASQSLVLGAPNAEGGTEALTRNFALNTLEFGPEVTYRVPRLWPLGCDRSKKSSEPSSSFGGALNYQRRPEFERTLSQFKYAWNWLENADRGRRITLDLLEFSVIKIRNSAQFEEFITRQNNAYLANSYNNHLIFASGITLTSNSQKTKYQRSYFYWRIGGSTAGNTMRLAMRQLGAELDSAGGYEIAGIRFAQYLRAENDLRYYYNLDEKNAFVVRAFTGIGRPGKNLSSLPFEKSFFSGGANGIRAWQARTLGPGSYRDSTYARTFNNIGELKLEGNVEYRFKMTTMLNWALFMDVGNIWLLQPDPGLPGADFNSARWLSEIAVGAGLGLRLDFDFFLVRTDLGIQLKDPAKIPGERWLWQPKDEYLNYLQRNNPTTQRVPIRSAMVFNLGIGFPF